MFLLLLVFLLTIFLFHNFYWKRRNLPPGPTPYPLLGNLADFIKNPPGDEIQLQWKRKYGDVFTVWLGSRPLVVIADYKLMVETFQKDGEAFAGRSKEKEYTRLVRGGIRGVMFTEGEFWRDQRRFSMHVLKDFGVGKSLMQEEVLDEIQTLVRRINSRIDQGREEFSINDLVDVSVGSIINKLMFGYHYSDDKIEEFNDLKERALSFVRVTGNPIQRLIRDWPQLYSKIPYFKSKLMQAKDSVHYLHEFFRERVKEHRQELKNLNLENETPTDFVMAFIQEWKKRDESGEQHYFNEEQLIVLLFDLWVAGQETTAGTILNFLAQLIHSPEVQRKAHKELDAVIGSDRNITMADKQSLPYINAIIMETTRIANLLPMNLMHRTTKDVMVGKYKLKKKTWVVPQISVLFCDPEIYENPKQFVPDRFIDENGKLKSSPELIPFSLGKRQCLGEGLARLELFAFISNLLNQFEFSPGAQMPNLERKSGVTVRLDNFSCRVQRRFN